MNCSGVCVHTNDKKYKIKSEIPESELSLINEIEHKTKVHDKALNNRVWDESETVYWQMDSEYEWLTVDKQEELCKLAFLETSLLTKLKIKQKRRITGDAQIVISWLGGKDEPYFKDRPSVLAFAYGPQTGIGGDITMNADQIWRLPKDGPITVKQAFDLGMIDHYDTNHPNNTLRTYDPVHTMKHEGGHAFGMEHINNSTFARSAIMYPFYNGLREFGDPDIAYLFELYTESSYWERVRRYIAYKMGLF